MVELPAEFHYLPRKEARTYLGQFVGELPDSQARLAQMLEVAGADPALAADLDPGRLDEIWAAVTGHVPLGWQEGYVDPPDTATPAVRKPTLAALGDLSQLPSWFVHDRTPFTLFAPGTLWVIDVLGRHLGEVFRAEWPTLEWMLGPARPASNIDKNKPVVGKGSSWINPLRMTSGIVMSQIRGSSPPGAVTTLGGLYDRQAAYAQSW